MEDDHVFGCFVLIMIGFVLLMIGSCVSESMKQPRAPVAPGKIENIVRVYTNGRDGYSAFVQKGKSLQLIRLDAPCEVVADVSQGEPMWILEELEHDPNDNLNYVTKYVIHIRSVADVDGGSFRFSTGKNTWATDEVHVVQ